jgi:predicted metal-dependent hydrolase
MIDYTLIRSDRKTIALRIREGGLEVYAPLKMKLCCINKFVSSREKWITGKLALSAERQKRLKELQRNDEQN